MTSSANDLAASLSSRAADAGSPRWRSVRRGEKSVVGRIAGSALELIRVADLAAQSNDDAALAALAPPSAGS
jgi:hypothetical protein